MKRRRKRSKRPRGAEKTADRRARLALLSGAVIISLIFLAYLLAAQISSSSFFKIKEVLVNDPSFDFSHLKGRDIVTISLKDAAAGVERDPRVFSVSIRKVFPSTLKVFITRRIPFAYVSFDGKRALVSRDGIVIPEEPEITKPILEIQGLSRAELAVLMPGAVRTFDYCKSFAPVKSIAFFDLTISVSLQTGETVLFPIDSLEEKLPVLRLILADFRQKGLIYKYLDFRFREPVFLPATKIENY